MKLVLNKDNQLKDDRVEIHYRAMNQDIDRVIQCVNHNSFQLEGSLNERQYTLDINDIYYFDTIDKRSFAYLEKQVYEVDCRLGMLEEKLREYGFIRVSKSVVVNVYKIDSIKSELNMRIKAYLQNGETLVISRHYKGSFEKSLSNIKSYLEEQ